jgi:hypothetical protein
MAQNVIGGLWVCVNESHRQLDIGVGANSIDLDLNLGPKWIYRCSQNRRCAGKKTCSTPYSLNPSFNLAKNSTGSP